MTEPLMSVDSFTVLVEGLDHPEGVAWGPDGYVYAGGEAGQIYRVSLDGKYEQIASTGGFILGLCLDADRNVYACDLGNRAVMRIGPDGKVSTCSDGSPERKMVSPNYPAFDLRGNLYVSDSGRWRQNNGCLFRIRPDGQTEIVSLELSQFPNGLALSPEGTHLYVVLSQMPGVVKVRIYEDGRVGPPETVVKLPRTVPDGLAFDRHGNLYISFYTPDVIYRLTPSGELAILAEDWESAMLATPTNIAFCGADLSILVVASLSRWHLAQARMQVPGNPIPYPHLGPPQADVADF